jgi:hypothetical protein
VQQVAVPLLRELVVRRAGNDLEAELRYRVVVDDGAERARREDLRIDGCRSRPAPTACAPNSSTTRSTRARRCR